jgi:putative ABC transport system substrate-binding protein
MTEISNAGVLWICSDNRKSKIKNPKWVGIVTIVLTFAFGGAVAQAQQPGKIPRIGYLAASFPSAVSNRMDAFRQRLRELGYVEGKTIVIESRYAEGRLERLPALVGEFVRVKVDVILSGGPAVTRPAKEATKTIPIVMTQDDDPVGNGFVASLARPGGNITGLSSLAPEISGKRLELLKEIIPQLSRVAILGTSTSPGNAQGLRETELAAELFRIQVQYQDVRSLGDIEPAFRAASQWRAEAVLVLGGPVLNSDRTQVVDLAAKNRLAATYNVPDFVEAGGLMTYGVSFVDSYRRAAVYVDKILKGAKPADLPVEQPTKFELVINLKTAKQIGLTIPPNVLARADKVIK